MVHYPMKSLAPTVSTHHRCKKDGRKQRKLDLEVKTFYCCDTQVTQRYYGYTQLEHRFFKLMKYFGLTKHGSVYKHENCHIQVYPKVFLQRKVYFGKPRVKPLSRGLERPLQPAIPYPTGKTYLNMSILMIKRKKEKKT